jgi:hypothetical protein
VKGKLQLTLSATALVVAVLGWTPLGQAAGGAIAKVVPFAKVAGFAKNAGAVNGHVSSRTPKAGQIPVLNALGKLPASLGAVGPAGPAGATGPAGAAGPAGASGVSGYQQVSKQINVSENGADETVSCPGGKSVLGGGYNLGGNSSDLSVYDSRPTSSTDWRIRIRNATAQSKSVTIYAVCATMSS